MKTVHFALGKPSSLASRAFTVTRMAKAGDTIPVAATITQSLSGSAEVTECDLPDNQIWQAKLIDTLDSGEVGQPHILNFNTGTLQFPGPGTPGGLAILAMEDLSSSSSSSSDSSMSSSSHSSSSSQSNSSMSSSSSSSSNSSSSHSRSSSSFSSSSSSSSSSSP